MIYVSYLWNEEGQPEKYGYDDVNRLDAGLRRHCGSGITHVCLADDPSGFSAQVEHLPISRLYREHGACYTKLQLFHRPELVSPVLALDLDCVVLGDLAPLFEHDKALALWEAGTSGCKYNTSIVGYDRKRSEQTVAGTGSTLQEHLTRPLDLPALTEWKHRANSHGSDQAWLHFLDPPCYGYTPERDGVLSYWHHARHSTPGNGRIVFFPGNVKQRRSRFRNI